MSGACLVAHVKGAFLCGRADLVGLLLTHPIFEMHLKIPVSAHVHKTQLVTIATAV